MKVLYDIFFFYEGTFWIFMNCVEETEFKLYDCSCIWLTDFYAIYTFSSFFSFFFFALTNYTQLDLWVK